MATEAVDSILKKYITQKRSRGAFTERELDKYAPEEPVVVDGVMKSTAGPVLNSDSEFDAIAKPVLTSWLKGKGGLNRVASGGLWDKDTVGGATANQYFANAKKFDNPALPLTERITNMIYGAETSGNPNAWKTQNQYGFMGRAQIGEPFMQDYGIDKKRYMSDPKYQHEATMSAVQRRIDELSGKYYKLPSMRNFEKGGLSGPLKKLYPEDDNTEDLLIVDPVTGQPYGGLRLGERIFSQRDTIRMDKLASGKNYDKLGKFVAKAISKHDEDETMFAGGGKIGDKNKASDQSVSSRGAAHARALNQIYSIIKDIPVTAEGIIEDKGQAHARAMTQIAELIQTVPESVIQEMSSRGDAHGRVLAQISGIVKDLPSQVPAALATRGDAHRNALTAIAEALSSAPESVAKGFSDTPTTPYVLLDKTVRYIGGGLDKSGPTPEGGRVPEFLSRTSSNLLGATSGVIGTLGDLLSEPRGEVTPTGAKDARGNEYTKNPDGTFARKGGGGNFTYDPNTKRFISTAAGQPKPTSVPAGAGKAGSRESSDGQPSSNSTVGEKSNKVKVLQEYLNGFFSAKALEQKGYTRGDNGELYDPEGKRVPIDKISTTAVNEQIAADGKFGQETEAALKLYNALNPKEQINYRTVGGALYLDESPVAEGTAAKTPFRQYLETGKVPRYDRSKVQVGEMTPKSKAGTVDLKNFKEMGIKDALPVVPIQASQKKAETPAGRVSGGGLTAANLNRLGGNAVDLLKVGVALRSANQPIPPYEESEDWKKYGQIVENRLNQGLSPEVQAQLNQNLNQNRMSGYAQIAAASGGGGSQGAVLGALGQVNQATAGAIGQFAVADQAQRDRNLAQFGSLAAQRENVNLGMYQQGVSRIERNNMQAASIIPQIGTNIEARNNYYRAVESPDSPYQKFMKSQLDKQQAETELAQRIAANPSLLIPNAVTPLAPGGLSQKDTSLINQTAKRLGQ